MIDPNREVPLVVGDTTYTLYGGNKGLRMLERESGKTILEVFESLSQGSVDLMTIALWGMLLRHHPELTVDDVDDIIDLAGYDNVRAALDEAGNRAFATMDGVNGDDAGKAMALNGAKPGAGTRSSRTGSRPA